MAEKKLLSILFPSWRKVTCLEDRMWDIEIDLDDENSYFQILGMIAHDQSLGSSNGKVRFFVISEAATRDIIDIQRQTSSQQLLTNLHFLQFEASRVPLIQAVNSGELHIAHDWIHNAFDDCVSRDIARKFHAGRVFDIFTSNSKCIVMNRMDSFRDFFGAFYYYCSARDALFEVAEQLQVFALRTIRNVEILNQQYIWTVSAITSWICQYNQPAASDLTAMIEYLVSRQEVPRRAAANLAIVLNGPASRFANGGARAWGKWLLENVRGELNSHQILNAYSSVIYTKEEYDLARDDILNACSRTHDELMTSGRSPISTLLVIDQRANTLSPYAYKLHKFGIGSDFIEILSRWYGIQPSKRLEGGTLVVLPSHSEGMAYIASQPIMLIDNNRDKSIEEAVISTNNALQISLNISGQRTPISEPVRQGQPNYENGADFEETLNRFYGFDKLQREELLKCTSMISFPGYPHPIQSMMRKEVGWAVPISASLKQPEPDRRVSKICVWYAGDDFYSKMEAEAVKSVFAKHSIQCDRYSGSDDSSASIREVYERVDYDVIWICGHGHYDHWDPSSPMIQVGTHSRFGAEDVSSWDVPGLGRRLLVLNVCDGGVAAVLGGIHKLGMAPMLASENQATVSHLWPVEPRVASAFGVLFANNLATQADLFNAFAKTLDEIRQPWSEISQFISEICPGELADRLRNCDHDMTNVFNFGSPVFFS